MSIYYERCYLSMLDALDSMVQPQTDFRGPVNHPVLGHGYLYKVEAWQRQKSFNEDRYCYQLNINGDIVGFRAMRSLKEEIDPRCEYVFSAYDRLTDPKF
jgi:hypothetical protein